MGDALGQSFAQALAAKLRANVKPLHLAGIVLNLVQSHTSCGLTIESCQQQASIRRRVVARQSRELLIEALEAKTEPERLRVFEKQFTNGCDLLRRFRLH